MIINGVEGSGFQITKTDPFSCVCSIGFIIFELEYFYLSRLIVFPFLINFFGNQFWNPYCYERNTKKNVTSANSFFFSSLN